MLNGELYTRPPRALGDGEALVIGEKTLTWLDAPHLPHGWECGYLFESSTRTLLCGDLFTQPGADTVPLSESDSGVLEPSEAMRSAIDYYAHARDTTAMLERLAAFQPQRLACMHGSAFAGDGARLLRELAQRL
jgi:glyoxylase-like metal-dependent hydrolase (beta-lactamase superfamily II)